MLVSGSNQDSASVELEGAESEVGVGPRPYRRIRWNRNHHQVPPGIGMSHSSWSRCSDRTLLRLVAISLVLQALYFIKIKINVGTFLS